MFIGHVDAGKSTTAGQILFLTGGVDDRTIEKYEREAKDNNRESWYMAYIMDTNEEERAKASFSNQLIKIIAINYIDRAVLFLLYFSYTYLFLI